MRASMWEDEGVEGIFEVNALPMGFLERLLSKYSCGIGRHTG